MEGSYKTFLEMKTLFAEFSPTFFSKLSKPDQDRFKQLIQAAESLKPQPQKNSKPRAKIIDQLHFHPRNIIFCLNLKKLFAKKKFSFIRFSFALIRCLFKESQRVERRKMKFEKQESKEPFWKDIGTDALEIAQETEQGLDKAKKISNLRVIQNLVQKNRKKHQSFKIFFRWRAAFKKSLSRKDLFTKRFEKICRNFSRKVWISLFRYRNWKRLAGDITTRALAPILKSRKNKIFLSIFFRGRFAKPQLTVDKGDILVKCNIKEKALLEISGNHSIAISIQPQKAKCDLEDENIQDFKYLERKNTKMMTKKKVLLGRAPKKIEKIEKNHQWVLAFALLKWKKQYFMKKSDKQEVKNIVGVGLEIISAFSSKYQKKLCSILFENLKVKYLISKQNKNFKTYLMFKMISGIISNKQNINVYRAFRAINSVRVKKVSFPALSIDMQGLHDMENSGDILYNVLKRIYQNSLLKKKVYAFISLQNFEPSSPIYTRKISINHLIDTLAKVIFFKKYLTFFEIKEKTFIISKKCDFLTYSIESALTNSTRRLLTYSIFMIKINTLDQIQHLLLDIAKVRRKELLRSSFEEIREYAIDMENFIFARNLFTGSLVKKIYFKRVSSSML